jgi:membrane protease YdiL (CAAX protease family)
MEKDEGTGIPLTDNDARSEGDRPGALRRIFRNRFGHWRAGWRFLVYAAAVFAVGKAIKEILKPIMAIPSEAPFVSWTHSVIWVGSNCALILGALIVLRWFDRRPTGVLGLGFSRGWLRELGLGLAAGVGLTGLLVALLMVLRSVSLDLGPQPAAGLAAVPLYLFIFSMAAAAEELVFRGYPLQALAEGSRRWIAAALLCIVFTLAHESNPDVTLIGVLNIFLASVVLTVIYFQTRRLWLPIAFHMSWNFCQSWLWGFDVSGIEITDHFFVMTPTGSEVLSGGEFGLEGSVATTIVFAALIAWLLLRPVLRPTAEVAALWDRYPVGFGLAPTPPPDA